MIARDAPGLARSHAQLVLEHNMVGKARIAEIKVDHQFAAAADARGKGEGLAAKRDLLVGDFERPGMAQQPSD